MATQTSLKETGTIIPANNVAGAWKVGKILLRKSDKYLIECALEMYG